MAHPTRVWLLVFVGFMLILPLTRAAALRSSSPSLSTPLPIAPKVSYAVHQDVSHALGTIKPIPPEAPINGAAIPLGRLPGKKAQADLLAPRRFVDPVLQDWQGAGPGVLDTPSMPAPLQNFEGGNNINFVLPPDPIGAAGPNHYVQWVNLSYTIYDKTGTRLYGPAAGKTLWSGFGGPCETKNEGDPIVVYDQLAGRWFLSQFASPSSTGPFYQCVAVSQGSDPLGAFNRYAFQISTTKFNDYPKIGVWPDGYYMSMNQFTPSDSWAGAGAVVFERDKMLAGLPARMVYFDLFPVNASFGGMLPSTVDGLTLPPAGSPAYFVEADDGDWGWVTDRLHIFEFHVDWTDTNASTFSGPLVLETASFDANLCNSSQNCIPQPGTTRKVDALSDRLMYRLQYRNFGDHEALIANHTVDVDGNDHAGIRWYELRKTAPTAWSIYQQGTFAPDADQRWMGSIAMDHAGNMALGYSVSSTSVYPSIRYAGRLVTDTLGTLPQSENTLIAGGGSQTSSASRWGDYSTMTLDPNDDCTFWYTQEYYATTSSVSWRTRIGSFRFPGCMPAATATPSITPTPTQTGTPTDTPTVTSTPSHTPTTTPTPSATETAISTPTDTPTATSAPTATPTVTDTPSLTSTPSETATVSPTDTLTVTNTPTGTPTVTDTPIPAATITGTPPSMPTVTDTTTATPTMTTTPTQTPTQTGTSTATSTVTGTATETPTVTNTSTTPPTVTATPTLTPNATNTPTATSTDTPSSIVTPTATASHTAMVTPTATTLLPLCYDLNGDRLAGVEDLQLVVSHLGSTDSLDLLVFDLNHDNQITVADIQILAEHWESSACPIRYVRSQPKHTLNLPSA